MLPLLHPSQPLVQGYADGDLPNADRELLSKHLRDCARCRERVSTLRALSAELSRLLAPQPPVDGLVGIVAARGAGSRTLLPEASAPPTHLPLKWAAAGALVILSVMAVRTWWTQAASESTAGTARWSGAFAWPTVAMAQAPSQASGDTQPRYPPVTTLDGSKLVEGRWRYRSEARDLGAHVERLVTVTRARAAGRPAWLIAIETQGPYGARYLDSTWFDQASLQPIRTKRQEGRAFVMTLEFTADSIYGVSQSRWPRDREYRDARPVRQPRAWTLPGTMDPLRVTLAALPLDRPWKGSIYLAGGAEPRGLMMVAPFELRVAGEATAQLPAGTFDCWLVVLQYGRDHSAPYTLWVAKRGGWVVRATNGPRQHPEDVLVSYEVRP